jgi:hypothetical protein
MSGRGEIGIGDDGWAIAALYHFIAPVFVLSHYGVAYTPRQALFLAAVLPLTLAWGWLMQKSDRIWGSVPLPAVSTAHPRKRYLRRT